MAFPERGPETGGSAAELAGDSRRSVSGLSRENSAYRHIIGVCDQIADATLTGADTRELCEMLARLIKKTVVLLDPRLELRTSASAEPSADGSPRWNPDDPGMARLLAALATERRPLRVPSIPDSILDHGCLAIPIGVGANELGYLLIVDGPTEGTNQETPSDNVDMLIASYVATMFALTLANERSNTDLGLRYRGGVVESLVAGQFVDTDDARRKVEALGFEASEALQVAVLRVAPKGAAPFADIADRRAEDLQAAIVRKLPRAAVTLRRHELIVLHGSDRTEDMRPADEMLPALERLAGSTETGSVLVAGVSEFGHRPTDIPRLYTEACHAVETSNLVPGLGRIVAYSGIGIYRLLLQVGDGRELTRFAESVLGPLLQYDASHKLGLIQTLAVYLNQRESLKQAARRLHVHTNTVTYRLQRIEQLTNLALSDPDDRLMAHVAVKILELKRRDAESGRRRRGGVPASELEHYAVY